MQHASMKHQLCTWEKVTLGHLSDQEMIQLKRFSVSQKP